MRNPKYKRPSWGEEIKPTLESIDSITKKINYLNRIMTDDRNEAQILLRGIVVGHGQEHAEILYPDFPDGAEQLEEENFKEETKDWRQKVDREIRFLEGLLPDDIVTRAELEKGLSKEEVRAALGGKDTSANEQQIVPKRIPWNGYNTQLIWLFKKLIESGLIPKSLRNDLHNVIAPHFLDRDAKPMQERNLAEQIRQIDEYVKKIRGKVKIESIIAEIELDDPSS